MTSSNNPTERVIPVDHVINETDPNEPISKRRGRVIVGALGGLAIGLLLATGAQQGSPDSETAPSTIPALAAVPTVPTSTTVLEPSRLDILVDGYEGNLYLVGAVNRQGKLWRWESRSGRPLEIDVPTLMTGSVGFNASGVRVAASARSSFSPLSVLWVGTPGNQQPLAVDVYAWSWHSSDPSRIAWMEFQRFEGTPQLTLRTATLPLGALSNSQIAEASDDEGRTIALFDEQGVVMQSLNETGYSLWTADLDTGEETARVAARYLGQLPDGTLLVSQAGRLNTATRDLAEVNAFPFTSDKRMDAIRVSPTDDRWAIWEIEETTGVAAPAQLWILDGEEVIFETRLPSALRAVSWSHDGRWLITAVGEPSPLSGFSTGELWFIDTTDWSMHAVAAPGFISAIAAVP